MLDSGQTRTFTYRYLYIPLPLHTATFTYRYLYIPLPLHTATFTHRYLYIPLPLHTATVSAWVLVCANQPCLAICSNAPERLDEYCSCHGFDEMPEIKSFKSAICKYKGERWPKWMMAIDSFTQDCKNLILASCWARAMSICVQRSFCRAKNECSHSDRGIKSDPLFDLVMLNDWCDKFNLTHITVKVLHQKARVFSTASWPILDSADEISKMFDSLVHVIVGYRFLWAQTMISNQKQRLSQPYATSWFWAGYQCTWNV